MSLLTELDAVYLDRRRCGELIVWIGCECGARIARRADAGDALDVNG